MVPVNEHARSVGVGIRLQDDPDAGRGPSIALEAETNGNEIVQLPLEDTELAPGVYFASSISLEGDDFPDSSEYTATHGEARYILGWRPCSRSRTPWNFELDWGRRFTEGNSKAVSARWEVDTTLSSAQLGY